METGIRDCVGGVVCQRIPHPCFDLKLAGIASVTSDVLMLYCRFSYHTVLCKQKKARKDGLSMTFSPEST